MREELEAFFNKSIRVINFNSIYKIILALLLYIFTLFMFSRIYVKDEPIPSVGDIAEETITANRTIRYENVIETQKRRERAQEIFKPVFDMDVTVLPATIKEVSNFFSFIHEQQNKGYSTAYIYSMFLESSAFIFDRTTFEDILEYEMENGYEEKLNAILSKLYNEGIISKTDLTMQTMHRVISNGVLIYKRGDFIVEEISLEPEVVHFIEDLYENMNSIIEKEYPLLRKDKIEILSTLASTFIKQNMIYNDNATENTLAKIISSTKPVYNMIIKGYVVVNAGEQVTEENKQILSVLYSNNLSYSLRIILGAAVFLLLVFVSTGFILIHNKNDFLVNEKKYTLLILEIFIVIVVAHLFKNYIDKGYILSIQYIPFYCYTMLPLMVMINTMINRKGFSYFIVYTVTFLCAILFQASFIDFFIMFIANIMTIFVSSRIKRRSQILLLGALIFLIYVIGISILLVLSDTSALSFAISILFAFSSVLAQSVLVTLFLPLSEYMLDTATVFKLQELADLNNPILKKLQMKAPGTYHHSISLSNIVETIASAINENSLLARVSAYYHDIGKIENQLYFIENTTRAENKHNKLKPTLSASIIKSHIKFGVEMAKENGLPKEIINAIVEHHGTTLIKYFYSQALKEAKEGEEVDKDFFTYPGPKPQSKITAIIMLIDSIEAASRALEAPTRENVEAVIKNIINDRIIEGELNESGLTLHDIDVIQKTAFQMVMVSFHERIAYPKLNEDDKKTDKNKQ